MYIPVVPAPFPPVSKQQQQDSKSQSIFFIPFHPELLIFQRQLILTLCTHLLTDIASKTLFQSFHPLLTVAMSLKQILTFISLAAPSSGFIIPKKPSQRRVHRDAEQERHVSTRSDRRRRSSVTSLCAAQRPRPPRRLYSDIHGAAPAAP